MKLDRQLYMCINRLPTLEKFDDVDHHKVNFKNAEFAMHHITMCGMLVHVIS